jgi:short-subunit dehydrogenase
VLSARHQDALERLAGELDSARVVVADLSLPQDVERLADEAGAVDILVATPVCRPVASWLALRSIRSTGR